MVGCEKAETWTLTATAASAMTLFSGFSVMFPNAEQALPSTASLVEFRSMTTTKACQGAGVSGWEKGKGMGFGMD